jgi:hypothetical protein
MTPEEYADKYLHLTAVLYDGTVKEVSIRKYLNTGVVWAALNKHVPLPSVPSGREKNAITEYFRVLSAVAGALKTNHPTTFTLDGWSFDILGVQRAYSGKGSPAEILDALWLANRFKFVDGPSLQSYCDRFLGLDCNGFVGNYVGAFGPVNYYDVNPRKEFADVSTGDPLTFYVGARSMKVYEHIGVVGRILSLASDKLTFNIVQSGGPEDGVQVTLRPDTPLKKDKDGTVYYDETSIRGWRGYFAAGPAGAYPRASSRYRAAGTQGEAIQVTRMMAGEF